MAEKGDLISRSALIAEYDRVHQGPPGGARKLMEEAPAVNAVPVEKYNELKDRYKKLVETVTIMGNELSAYEERYGDLEE